MPRRQIFRSLNAECHSSVSILVGQIASRTEANRTIHLKPKNERGCRNLTAGTNSDEETPQVASWRFLEREKLFFAKWDSARTRNYYNDIETSLVTGGGISRLSGEGRAFSYRGSRRLNRKEIAAARFTRDYRVEIAGSRRLFTRAHDEHRRLACVSRDTCESREPMRMFADHTIVVNPRAEGRSFEINLRRTRDIPLPFRLGSAR